MDIAIDTTSSPVAPKRKTRERSPSPLPKKKAVAVAQSDSPPTTPKKNGRTSPVAPPVIKPKAKSIREDSPPPANKKSVREDSPPPAVIKPKAKSVREDSPPPANKKRASVDHESKRDASPGRAKEGGGRSRSRSPKNRHRERSESASRRPPPVHQIFRFAPRDDVKINFVTVEHNNPEDPDQREEVALSKFKALFTEVFNDTLNRLCRENSKTDKWFNCPCKEADADRKDEEHEVHRSKLFKKVWAKSGCVKMTKEHRDKRGEMVRFQEFANTILATHPLVNSLPQATRVCVTVLDEETDVNVNLPLNVWITSLLKNVLQPEEESSYQKRKKRTKGEGSGDEDDESDISDAYEEEDAAAKEESDGSDSGEAEEVDENAPEDDDDRAADDEEE